MSKPNLLDSRVADTYVDALSGNTLVYLQQTYLGIDVDKIIQVLAFKNGKLVSSAGKRLDLSLVNTTQASLQKKIASPPVPAEQAIQAAAQHLHLAVSVAAPNSAIATKQDFSRPKDFGDLGVAKENVTARLIWVPQKSFERVKLVWEVNLSPKKSSDNWRLMVDAAKGNVVKKENYTVYEKEGGGIKKGGNNLKVPGILDVSSGSKSMERKTQSPQGITSVTYRVIPFPAEAPTFPKGTPALTTDPWTLSPAGSGAVPFIWNDDGSRQYKFTRGNNVLAQEDLDGNDSVGKRARGVINKHDLFFDFMPDFNQHQ